jgi:protein-tyrosine-phosphatase
MIGRATAVYCMTTAQREAIQSIAPYSTVPVRCLDPDGDITDPHGKPATEYQHCADRIRHAVSARLAELNPPNRLSPTLRPMTAGSDELR